MYLLQLFEKEIIPNTNIRLAMKSLLTGSTRITEILNRLKHTASYHTIKDLVTVLTFQATEKGSCTSTGMGLSTKEGIWVVFDNFDRFMETLNVKYILHNAVGIANQSSIQ